MNTHTHICPKCGGKLDFDGNSYRCEKRHTYDRARSGYVNFLMPDQMNSKLPGDNKLMVNARKSFLSKGYYSKLMEKFCGAVKKYAPENAVILDAGCGEGYYTVNMAKAVPDAFIMGTDISKTAVDAAAKRGKADNASNLLFSVSSVFHLPVESSSCNMLTTLFAPYCAEEFLRVLRPDGVMIMVIPSERHLIQLKEAVYDEPYLNEVKDFELEGFTLEEHINVADKIKLDSTEDILNLFSMTPYYYKTGEDGHKKLSALSSLETEIGFEILIYSKK
ncbi:MAG: methyltransferase domain-containing protein [Oscillospiraceae bacterium]|nr:methyltransferase domain-containing protein [Oscillospiraceae bacterium]